MNDWLKIFVDFDGTITRNDVGYEMFKEFTNADTEEVVQLYRRGKIGSFECLSKECEIWNQHNPSPNDYRAFLEAQQLRNGFDEFLKWAKTNNIDPIILSEGFDFYIDKILSQHDLNGLERICNHADENEDGQIHPAFPYYDRGCGKCSNCKGYHISKLTQTNQSSIFIGDGHSDLHAARAADIIFARSDLSKMLGSSSSHIEYDDFYDIIISIVEIIKKKIFAISRHYNFCVTAERHRSHLIELWENSEVMKNDGYPDGLGWTMEQYDSYLNKITSGANRFHFSLEDKSGKFVGECGAEFPDSNKICKLNVRLYPEFRGKDMEYDAWNYLVGLAQRRWPDSAFEVTPSIENVDTILPLAANDFRIVDNEISWLPPKDDLKAVPFQYIKMIRKPKGDRKY